MKKVLVLVLSAGLSAAAFAGSPGFYVQGDVGYAGVHAKEDGEKLSEKGFSPRISGGYDFGSVRVAADYTHYKNLNASGNDGGERYHLRLKNRSLGISGIYDFDIDAPVKPYVGARLALNRISSDYSESAPGYSYSDHNSKTKLGVGAMVGASYNVSDNIAVDAGYRRNYWGKFDGVKVHSNELHGGVRVKF